MTKRIPLTQGKFSIVDDEDYEFLMQWKWHINSNGYAVRRPYIKGSGRDKQKCLTIRMHRLLGNTPDGLDTDHINGDRLDNRKSNIRICTRSQNLVNKKIKKKFSSIYRGVNLHKSGKWLSKIHFNRRFKYLGYFDTQEEAALAYNSAAKIIHGEYAVLNEVIK